jgi:HNH endonuclease/AP2 domain
MKIYSGKVYVKTGFENRPLPPRCELLDFFNYNPTTGLLTWKRSGKGIREGASVGRLRPNGYMTLKIFRKEYLQHRIIYYIVTGKDPGRMQIDHINGIKNDNRIDNLRLATSSNNSHNTKTTSRNTSGIKGVSFVKAKGLWLAQFRANYKTIQIGFFANKEDAGEAVKEAREQFHGKFTHHG